MGNLSAVMREYASSNSRIKRLGLVSERLLNIGTDLELRVNTMTYGYLCHSHSFNALLQPQLKGPFLSLKHQDYRAAIAAFSSAKRA